MCVVCCLLFVVYSLLFVVCCFVVCRVLFRRLARCSLFVVGSSLRVVRR